MKQEDYYEVLGCDPTSSAEEIKKAYRELAGKLHPDVNPPRLRGWAERQMKQLNQAYDVLGDPDRRSRYDMARRGGDFAPFASHAPAPTPSPLANPMVRYIVSTLIIMVALALLPALFRLVLLNPKGMAAALVIIGLGIGVSRLRRRSRGA